MFDESAHTALATSQKSKTNSIKRTASAIFSRFSSSKLDNNSPLQRDLLKRIYTESDFQNKKDNGVKRYYSKPVKLSRTFSNISVNIRNRVNDFDLEKDNSSVDSLKAEPDLHVKDIEPNSREQPTNKCSLTRRPATRLVDSSNISRRSGSLNQSRKNTRRVPPFSQIRNQRHSVMFPDVRLNSVEYTKGESDASIPSSAIEMKVESDNESPDITSGFSDDSTGLPLTISITSSRHSAKEDGSEEKKSYSEPLSPNDANEDGWLDVSFNKSKTRTKSKSIDFTFNKRPELTLKRLSYTNERHDCSSSHSGPSSPSVEPGNRQIHQSAEKPPMNRSSSTKSTLSISSSVSSRSMFGRMESYRKESKAIGLWHSTVEKLMEKSEKTNEATTVAKPHSADKIEAMAKFIIGELYSTEKSFHQLLKFTSKNYMEAMQTAVQSKDPLVKASDAQVLFYALPELIETSEKLLELLKNYIDGRTYQDCSPGMALGHIFKTLEDNMVAFLKYATHYKANMKSIRKARNSAYVSKIENQLKIQKANNRLDLADYLIAPFQRVPRYGLLIKDLLKYTDATIKIQVSPTETRIHPLLEAQNIIDGLAITMNQVQQKHTRKPSGFYTFTPQSASNLIAQT